MSSELGDTAYQVLASVKLLIFLKAQFSYP